MKENQETSKTNRALALVDGGMNPHAASKCVGLSPNVVYSALKNRRKQFTCPCCGSKVEELRKDPVKSERLAIIAALQSTIEGHPSDATISTLKSVIAYIEKRA